MSFSFGFGGDDIDNDDDVEHAVDKVAKMQLAPENSYPPQALDFWTSLAELPSQISYNTIELHSKLAAEDRALHVFRRSLFDIRTQLMAEATAENDNDALLSGLDAGDLTGGTYEGGFKTWECSVDLAEYLISLQPQGNLHLIELGAGSAIPSSVLLQQSLSKSRNDHKYHFTLCDYNTDVLKLCTVPNVYLNAEHALARSFDLMTGEGDIDITARNVDVMASELRSRAVSISLVSGAWGEAFVDLVLSSRPPDLGDARVIILASETIYSPESLQAFNDTLAALLRSTPGSVAYVAAKKVYFGVGGGIGEFTNSITQRGALVNIVDTTDDGVGRVIAEVSMPLPRTP